MAATFNEIGVECVTATLVESVDVSKNIDHKIVKTNLGAFDSGTSLIRRSSLASKDAARHWIPH